MKNTHAITIIILVFIGVGAGVYLFIKNTGNPSGMSQVSQNQQNIAATSSDTMPERKNLTREELLSAEWPLDNSKELYGSWKRFGDYEIKFDQKTYPDIILVRKVSSQEEVAQFSTYVFVPSLPDVVQGETQENVSSVEIIANPELEKLYAFFTFGNSHGGGFRKVYESDLLGKNVRELTSEEGDYAFPESYRFSPDYTTLSYVTDESEFRLEQEDALKPWELFWVPVGDPKIYFHIIDLLDPNRSIKFILPGRSRAHNWVAAWRFADENTIEFTRYFARGNEGDGYTQISDKELLSYSLKNGRLILLKTIPLKQ